MIGGFVPEPWIPSWGSGKGINRGTGGGKGVFDDSSTDILISSKPAGIGSTSVFTIYNITLSQLNAIGDWLNNNLSLSVQDRTAFLQNVIAVKYIPFPVLPTSAGTKTVYIGDQQVMGDLGALQAVYITDNIIEFSFGSVRLDEYFGNFLDYAPYTTISLYLPFVGYVDIDTDEVMGGTISIQCRLDCVTGEVVYVVSCVKDSSTSVVTVQSADCSSDIPLTATDYSGKISAALGLIGGIVSIGAGIASIAAAPVTGGSSLAAGAMIAGGTASAVMSGAKLQDQPNPSKQSGAVGKSAGNMSIRYPFISITRPVLSIPETFAHEYGYMYNGNARLSSLTGMTVVSSCHVDGITGATEDDIKEIEDLLHSGVIL